MKLDYHIHTKLCKHASGEMSQFVEQAIAMGFDEMAFTDHIPLPQKFDLKHRMSLSEMEDYLNEIERLKSRYDEINILSGIEADFYDGFEDFLGEFLKRFPLEIVILSVHFIRDWPTGNWVFGYYFPDRPLHAVYSDYLRALMRGVETGLFNVLGHFDLVKRDSAPLIENNENEIRALLESVRRQGMAVEINTSGLRKEIGETYPHHSLWPLIAEFRLPVTLGSDAHSPNQVGYAFDRVEPQLAKIKGLQKVRMEKGKFVPVNWADWTVTIHSD